MISCKCLNILIETSSTKFQMVEKGQLELTIEESEDRFFKEEVLRRIDKLDGIQKSLPSLVETREVGSWIVHYCINCNVHTHALHKKKGAAFVLIGSNLLSADAIKKLRSSENYSKVYGVIINDSLEDESDDIFYPSHIEPIIKGLKQTVTETMRKENALVEERIKQFTEEQYLRLDSLRDRLFNEERALIRAVVSHKSAAKLEDKSPEATRSDHSTMPISPQKKPKRFSSKRHKSAPLGSVYNHELLFEFDDIERRPCSEQETDDSDSDDGACAKPIDRRLAHKEDEEVAMKMAKSLPMDIPVFLKSRRRTDDELDEELALSKGVDIAASIKKLAQSVHGGDIFGELPRPRFSTQL